MSIDEARRCILFTSGIRSEYDILYSVMRAVDRDSRTETKLVVTGAHLTSFHGGTGRQAETDGFTIVARIESLLNSDTAASRAKSAAIQLSGLVDVFTQVRPSAVVAMGDREEALTVAVAGAYMGIPVAHIGAGDHADDANIDNSVRHAVTKLAHLHLTTTEQSANRVKKLGEEPWRVHVVGAPGLDRFLETDLLSRTELGQYFGSALDHPYAVVIQHSISTEIEQADAQMQSTLEAVAGAGIPALVSYPNSDAGSHQIAQVIEAFVATHPALRVYRNLPRSIFVNVLRHAAVLVGNSSCGILEAPSLKLPVVNVGTRQVGREHAENVIFVSHDTVQIAEAVRRAVCDESFKEQVQRCRNPYGDGHAGERIARILAEVPIGERLVSKRNTF